MALRQLIFLGNPVLRAKAAPIAGFDDPKIVALARDMTETMLTSRGVGLAAPQVGEGLRLIVFWLPEERAEPAEEDALPLHILVNPEITPLSAEQELGQEGCLSLPGLRGMVPRFTHIGYRGYDLAGRLIEREAQGFHARVVQHEVDHLDGVMYLDRMRGFDSLAHESEIRKRLLKERQDDETEKDGAA
ncbi:MAG: peptide deformylase [Alphaproteobacteria bacterium]